MPYREKITKAGRTILIERGYTSRYNQKGGTRRKHMQPTKEAQERANIRKSEKDMTILMNANFNSGDMHVVLTYDSKYRPETLEQVKADRKEFIDRLRKACRKRGIRLIYIVCSEAGKRGALHQHAVIPKMDIGIVNECWTKGWINIYPLSKTGEYSKLANYFVKYRRQWKELKGPGRAWSVSRGMFRPEPRIRIIKDRNSFYEEPRPRKGYYVAKDTVRHGVHEETGYTFLEYILVEHNERRAP